MSLRLILTRHAKSDWGDAATSDHARPLNARGRAAAPRIGAWLWERDYLPDTILCSDATRTAETRALVFADLPGKPFVEYRRDLYHAAPGTLLAALNGADGATVMMIGHNPGIGAFARGMASTPPDHPRFLDYPTAATTVLDFDAPRWTDVTPGTGRVLNFVTPHDLT